MKRLRFLQTMGLAALAQKSPFPPLPRLPKPPIPPGRKSRQAVVNGETPHATARGLAGRTGMFSDWGGVT